MVQGVDLKIANFLAGEWVHGAGDGVPLVDPVLGVEIARASTEGVDLGAALDYARRAGGPALKAMSYAERAALLAAIAETLSAHRKDYFEIALANSGSPEGDAAIDIDGAIFTLKYFARLGATLGANRFLHDGAPAKLGRDDAFQGLHIAVPLSGVAIHINAFNFPAWGLWEKAAPALLSGVPVLAKPATSTALLAQRMVGDVVEAGILPAGALSIACGGVRDLLDHAGAFDAIAFTGSADTAQRIRGHPAVLRHATRVNLEGDSVNCALLGPDAAAGSPEFDLFVKEVVREMTVKAGQKCTAIRRVLAPAPLIDALGAAIAAKLQGIVVGNPRNPSVRMGPLVSKAQQAAALTGLEALRRDTRVVFDGGASFAPVDADAVRAAFVAPTLLACDDARRARAVHEVEVFGPVATLVPYADADDAFAIARLGQGSLVASVFSGDDGFALRAAVELADTHGRVLCVNEAVGKIQTGHGNVMPMCIHGGPGRAGGGEELGGMRALAFYHQRCAVQAHADRVAALRERSAAVAA
jgi:3,4-dehydroadipyl-CoA semialdehyde dehydrogenase